MKITQNVVKLRPVADFTNTKIVGCYWLIDHESFGFHESEMYPDQAHAVQALVTNAVQWVRRTHPADDSDHVHNCDCTRS